MTSPWILIFYPQQPRMIFKESVVAALQKCTREEGDYQDCFTKLDLLIEKHPSMLKYFVCKCIQPLTAVQCIKNDYIHAFPELFWDQQWRVAKNTQAPYCLLASALTLSLHCGKCNNIAYQPCFHASCCCRLLLYSSLLSGRRHALTEENRKTLLLLKYNKLWTVKTGLL